ncbi:MAG: toxin-antitoxin system YwqK family antitoxin [Bacteroidota bacterium]|nr:toxin-antitoxin system YwqK family antitoxin [Bacteroidota bacterium]MDP4204560.1 toxin-antitoxin system YwqK family antitoxin [Bacteroidota bacterium]
MQINSTLRRVLITFFLLLTIVISSFAQNQVDSKGQKQGAWIGRFPDGKTRYEGVFKNNRPDGLMKRYYANGNIKAEMFFYEDGQRTRARLFDENGKLIARGNYFKMEKDSVWNYFQDGCLIKTEVFKTGKKDGVSHAFDANGKMIVEAEWKNGKMNGAYKRYFPNGKLMVGTKYFEGKRNGLCVAYFESGEVEVEGLYVTDLREGDWKYYSRDGKIKYTLKYKNGDLLNSDVLDHVNQQIFDELEKNKLKLKDPEFYRNNPDELISPAGN